MVRRWIKALPAGRRQHGPAPGGIRGALLAWPAVDQGFVGGAAPTWAGGERDSGFPVGVARRWDKGLPAGRRQHGQAPGGVKGESDVDAFVFPPHSSTPLSELMHEYRFSIPCITSNHFYTIFLLFYFQPGIKVMHKQLFSAFRHHILPFPPASFL